MCGGIGKLRRAGKVVGYDGKLEWDTSKPDRQPRRMLDTRRAFHEFGFEATTDLGEGLKRTIDYFKKTYF